MILTHLVLLSFLNGAGGVVPSNGGENLEMFLGASTSLRGALSAVSGARPECGAFASLRAPLRASPSLSVETYVSVSQGAP